MDLRFVVGGGESPAVTAAPEQDRPGHPLARALLDHWRTKRGGKALPYKSDFVPGEMVPWLAHLFIAEPIPGDWRIRLFGTGLCARFGVDLTGKTYRQVLAPRVAQNALRLHQAIVAEGVPSVLAGAYSGSMLNDARAERLCLPMLAADGRTVWVIGGVFFLDEREDATWPGIVARRGPSQASRVGIAAPD